MRGLLRTHRTAVLERSFLLTLAGTFLLFLAVNAFVLMPRQLWELGAPESVIGWVMGTTQLATALAMPVVGLMLHRFSPRSFMQAGALVMALGCAAIGQLHDVGWAWYAARAAQGLAFAAFFVSAGTLVVTVVPDDRRAQGISLWGAGVLITQALAPMGGEWLLARSSFAALYRAAALASVGALVVSLLLPPHRPPAEAPSPLGRLLLKPALASGLLALLSGSLGFGAIYAFLAAFTEREGMGPVAPFFVAYTVGSLVIRLVAGRLADRFDRRLVIAPTLAGAAASIAALAWIDQSWQLALVGAAYGVGSGLSYPALMAYVVDQADPADRARAVALDNWAFTLGMLLAAAGFGPLAEWVGMRAAFAAVAALGVAAALALLAVRPPPRQAD